MNSQEQLDMWVDGNPKCPNENGECCPDFSCCTGNISPLETRERFALAYKEKDDAVMNEMLMMFLGNAFASEKVYVAGGADTEINT